MGVTCVTDMLQAIITKTLADFDHILTDINDVLTLQREEENEDYHLKKVE